MTGARKGRSASAGFTLLEVLLAFTILSFITTILWGAFSQTATAKRGIQAAQTRTHTARVALMRMAREIEMAFLSDSENTTLQERRTLFISTAHTDVDELRFSAFAHVRLRAGATESDTSVVSYYGERDPDDRSVLNVMRRETRRLQAADPKTVAGEAYILCPDVVRLKLAFYDARKKEWQESWTTIGADGSPYLPTHVRISLTVLDDRGQEVSYATDARIHLTEKVAYRPERS